VQELALHKGPCTNENMHYFDTHAHLDFPDYNKDREKVIEKSLKEGVFVINIGTDSKTSDEVVQIAQNYKEGVYAALGLHPLHVDDEDFSVESYRKKINKKVVAVGETGLDYKNISGSSKEDEELKEKQKQVFKKHIELAKSTNLPLVLHCRKAHKDMIEILESETRCAGSDPAQAEKEGKRGVLHCFSGNLKEARRYIELGFFLGINGIIFKLNLEKTIKEIPLEHMLLETDCPFLSPLKDKKRNEPVFVKYIAREVARIKNISEEEVAEVTTKNAKTLFNI
jgi:TatD DNase family protein